MKVTELFKKLGNKLIGKKSNTSAAGNVATVLPAEKALGIASRVHDGLGVIQLHENWRNRTTQKQQSMGMETGSGCSGSARSSIRPVRRKELYQ
jgi:hypothetical protein